MITGHGFGNGSCRWNGVQDVVLIGLGGWMWGPVPVVVLVGRGGRELHLVFCREVARDWGEGNDPQKDVGKGLRERRRAIWEVRLKISLVWGRIDKWWRGNC